MLHEITCNAELHMTGGDGTVLLADTVLASERIKERFGGKASMVYADPPFGTGGSFEFRRGKRQVAYTDTLGREEYRAMIAAAARLAHALLNDEGTFFLHIDYRMSHICRMICDEVFGEDALANEIIWAYKSGGRSQKSFSKKHDTILMYRKTPSAYFNIEAVGVPRGPVRRNHMKREMDKDGRMYYSIRTGGREYRYYDDDPVYPSDVWDDIEHLHQRDPERTGFLTQKPEALLRRMILTTTRPDELVVDLFGGSGTAAAVAAKEGRRFVSIDRGPVSLAVTRSRLIERSLERPFYEAVKPLTVEYEEDLPRDAAPDPAEYFDIAGEGGKAVLIVKKLPKEQLPYFAAVGSVEQGVFNAHEYLFTPASGDGVTVHKGGALLLTGADMRSGVYVYEAE